MRDDEGGAALHGRLERGLKRRSVAGSSALVASSRIRIGGSFRSARATASRWRSPPDSAAALADARFEPSGLARDEVGPAPASRRRELVIGRIRRADAQILRDRAVEQHRLLKDDADIAAEPGERHLADIHAVDRDGPDCGSKTRCRSASVVDLPVPVAPTRATRSPARRESQIADGGRLPS